MDALRIAALGMVILTSACYGPSDYLKAPDDAVLYGSGGKPIDPEHLRVDSAMFPKFRARRNVTPPGVSIPISMLEILPSDIWEVRYRLKDYYLLFSKSYNDRQCLFLNKTGHKGIAGVSPFTGNCNSQYFYTIYVDATGNITGGWEILFNPDRVISSSERRIHLAPKPATVEAWGPQPVFEKIGINR